MVGPYDIHQLFNSPLDDPALVEDRQGTVTLVPHHDPPPSDALMYWRRAALAQRYQLPRDATGKPLLTEEACTQLRQEAQRYEGATPPLAMTCPLPHYS